MLIEKPITLNATEAPELADLAREGGLFCAEALWPLFTPKFDVIRQVLDAGMLGEISTVPRELRHLVRRRPPHPAHTTSRAGRCSTSGPTRCR